MFTVLKRHLAALLTAAVLMLSTGGLLAPAFAYADASTDAACQGIGITTDGGCTDSSVSKPVDSLVATIVNILSWVVGIVAVIMIIIGGFKYITSGGESSKVSSAKNTLIYALVGVAIVVLAQVLVHFVINTATPSTDDTSTMLMVRIR